MSLKVMKDAMLKNPDFSQSKNRPLIYSESTWPGSGAHGGTYIGDMPRIWDSLRTVIS